MAFVFLINLFTFLEVHNIAVLIEEIESTQNAIEEGRKNIIDSYLDYKMHITFNNPPDEDIIKRLLEQIDKSELLFIQSLEKGTHFLRDKVNSDFAE